MNYEKKYKEVLEQAKQAIENIPDKSLISWLENNFPELRESEDERIRKEIIAYLDVQDFLAQGKDGDFKEWITWLEKQGEQKSWREEDEEMIDFMIEFIESLWWRKDLTKRKDEVLSWLKSTKDRVQPKQEWSEEDEKIYSLIYSAIKNDTQIASPSNKKDAIDWLKSLKPHWKPSEGQMEALNKAKNSPANYHDTRLELQSLYNDLKKL